MNQQDLVWKYSLLLRMEKLASDQIAAKAEPSWIWAQDLEQIKKAKELLMNGRVEESNGEISKALELIENVIDMQELMSQ